MARTLPNTAPQMKKSPTCSVPLRTSTVATGPRPRSSLASSTVPIAGRLGIGLEILQIGHQQDHLEQQVEILLHLGRDRNHDGVAAPIFGQQAAVGELLLDALRLRVGLVDLVDRDDDRHLGGAGVVDGFERLRHHAVVRRHHQHHDIGDFGAARTHAGERFVARRIDEDDLAAVLLDVIRADVLRDAAGFSFGDVGLPDGVEQRRLAVIHVAHDGDHGRALDLVLLLLRRLDLLHGFFFEADGGGRGAELARQIGGELGIERLVDGGEDIAVDQLLDHQAGFDVQLLGKFLDGDAFGNRDLAIDRRRPGGCFLPDRPQNFFFLLVLAVALRAPAALVGGRRCCSTGGGARPGAPIMPRDVGCIGRGPPGRMPGAPGRVPRATSG